MDGAPMNDDEILERLQRIDPLREGVHLMPAHSAQALTLMESIMSTDLHTRPSDLTPETDSPDTVVPIGRSTRRRWYATLGLGAAAAAAAITAALVVPGPGSTSATLAWTPAPRAATDADAEVARQTCVVPPPAAAEQRADEAGGAPAAPAFTGPTSPDMLPPLAAIDLRGNGGLAVFTDGVATVMCLLQVVDGTPIYAGMTMFDAVASPTDTLLVEGAMTTALDSGAAVSMITGQAGPAARVELVVPGLDPITATVVDGRFAAWWPEPAADGSTSLTGDVRIRALAADGTLLADVAWLDTAGAKGADAAPERTPQP